MTDREQHALLTDWQFRRQPERVMEIRRMARAAVAERITYHTGYVMPVRTRPHYIVAGEGLPVGGTSSYQSISVRLLPELEYDLDAALLMAERQIEEQWTE